MKNEFDNLSSEIEKMKEVGVFNYTFPQNYDSWTSEDKKALFIAMMEEKEKLLFKQDFIKRHRRRIFVFSTIAFIAFSFINPILGGIISAATIVIGYFLEKAVRVVKL